MGGLSNLLGIFQKKNLHHPILLKISGNAAESIQLFFPAHISLVAVDLEIYCIFSEWKKNQFWGNLNKLYIATEITVILVVDWYIVGLIHETN